MASISRLPMCDSNSTTANPVEFSTPEGYDGVGFTYNRRAYYSKPDSTEKKQLRLTFADKRKGITYTLVKDLEELPIEKVTGRNVRVCRLPLPVSSTWFRSKNRTVSLGIFNDKVFGSAAFNLEFGAMEITELINNGHGPATVMAPPDGRLVTVWDDHSQKMIYTPSRNHIPMVGVGECYSTPIATVEPNPQGSTDDILATLRNFLSQRQESEELKDKITRILEQHPPAEPESKMAYVFVFEPVSEKPQGDGTTPIDDVFWYHEKIAKVVEKCRKAVAAKKTLDAFRKNGAPQELPKDVGALSFGTLFDYRADYLNTEDQHNELHQETLEKFRSAWTAATPGVQHLTQCYHGSELSELKKLMKKDEGGDNTGTGGRWWWSG